MQLLLSQMQMFQQPLPTDPVAATNGINGMAPLPGGVVNQNYLNLMMKMFSNFNEPSSIPVSVPPAEPKEKKKKSKP